MFKQSSPALPSLKTSFVRLSLLAAVATGCAVEPGEYDSDSIRAAEQEIFNGTAVTRGSMADRGVVRLMNGCSGTLLTNQHVLTARHCVRQWNNANPGAYDDTPVANFDVRLEGDTAADDQTIATSRFLEPNTSTLGAGDYAVVELSAPFEVEGETDNFYNPIYGESDANLVGKTLLCAGYGWGNYATSTTFASGGGTLRSAQMVVQTASNGTITFIPNSLNQILAPGDSGSTCFLDNQVVGVHSFGAVNGWFDVNGNGTQEREEQSSRSSATQAAPSVHRSFSRGVILANANVLFTFAPALNQSTLTATVESLESSININVISETALSAIAPRSGWITARVLVEPTNTMCSVVHAHPPLNGNATLRGVCMSDGLLAFLSIPLFHQLHLDAPEQQTRRRWSLPVLPHFAES